MVDRANHGVRDANLIQTKALPSGASSVYTDGIDLGALNARGARLADCEMLVSAPALAVGELANASTMKYDIQTDDDSAFGSPTTVALEVIVQTGAGGVGDAADSFRYKIPSDSERYIRIKATNSHAADASAKSMTMELLF